MTESLAAAPLRHSAIGDPIDSAPAAVVAHWQQLRDALVRDDLDGALGELDQITALIPEDDHALRDRLVCARAAVLLEFDGDFSLEELRAILMRSRCSANQHLAAYQIARWFELRKQPKKGIFYARIAVDHAPTERRDLLAFAQNLLANLLTAESRFDQALGWYRTALGLHGHCDDVWAARISANVGYCETVLGRPRAGLGLIYDSLRRLRRHGAERYQISTLLDLAFALLEVERPAPALRHANRAAALAERFGDGAALHNALYLIGEAAGSLGRTFEARRAFQRLATSTGRPELTDYLLATDVRALVNLKA